MRERPTRGSASRVPRSRLAYVLAGALVVVAALVSAAALTSGSAQAQAQATPPSNTAVPAISGTAAVGQTLTANSGSWSGDTPMTFAYQWLQCDTSGASCVSISGATSSTYVVASTDVGKTLRVRVTATNATGQATADSNQTALVSSATVPANTVQPAVSGSTVQGQTLTGTTGTWSGSTPITYAYQWVRCPTDGGLADGSNCTFISGATSATYVLQAADVGLPMRVRVTATNGAGSQTAASNPTALVTAPAGSGPPKNTKEPSVSGATVQGQTLSADAGSWSGTQPISFAYQWLSCDAGANNCVAIAGATGSTRVLAASEVNRRIRIRITASNSAGSLVVTSNATGTVTGTATTPPPPPPPPSGSGAVVPISSVALPDRLIVDRLQWSPSRIHSRLEPLVGRFHVIEQSRGNSVSGAYVYAVGVPFGWLSNSAEVLTDQTGWATITFRVLPGLPLRPGNFVVVFVRARKPGENLLGGVSTRRLVSVRVG